jgi:membrane fusion protein, adhesin transport system
MMQRLKSWISNLFKKGQGLNFKILRTRIKKQLKPKNKWLKNIYIKKLKPYIKKSQKFITQKILPTVDTRLGAWRQKVENYLHMATSPQPDAPLRTRMALIYQYLHQQTTNPAQFILKIIVSFLVIFILWASFFQINETVKGAGQIIPSKRLQVIDNLEGGIIKEILIQEGEVVKKDQILVRLDPTANLAQLEELTNDFFRYQLTVDRLKAQIKNDPFSPNESIQKKLPELTRQEDELYKASLEKFNKELAIAQEEIDAKKFALQEAESKFKYAKEQLPVIEEQYNITETLFKKGLYSKLKNLEIKRQLLDTKSQISTLEEQIPRFKAEHKQAEEKLNKIRADYDAQNKNDLKEAELKLTEAQSKKSIMEDRLKRQEITSPINGVIKELHVKTLGGVIQPAEDILTIVPVDDELLAEINIAPDDIGFIELGFPVRIKISAYDYTIYGQLTGKVEVISADALQDPKQERSFFRILVRSDKNYLEKNGKKLYLSPGMQVDADIETGRRSVMTFLLKPILRTFDRALTER